MLTTEQLQALKAYIEADEVLNAFPKNSDGAFAIKDIMNLTADPAFVAWETDVPTVKCKRAMNWPEIIDLSVGQRDTWMIMLSNGSIDPSDPNIRQGIEDIFKGPQGDVSMAALIAIAKRSATVAEKLFATGDGTDATPATMTFEGNLSYQDVQNAWAV